MHGDFITKDKNGFNLYERHCPICGAIGRVYKPSLNRQCRSCANKARSIKHGLSGHPIYGIWESMVGRCENANNSGYKYYGEKGIKVCTEWRNNPAVFVEWALKNGYKKGLQVDRIDPGRNYEPQNCRLVSKKENVRRARRYSKLSHYESRKIKQRLFAGEKGNALAKEYGVSTSLISLIKRRSLNESG